MLRKLLPLAALASLLLAAAAAAEPVRVAFPSLDEDLTGGAPTMLAGFLYRPAAGPRPAVVALHGCGGLFRRDGELGARHADWGERLRGAGYVVLFPDSFGPRGKRTICTDRARTIRPGRERVRDAYAAGAWLAAQPFVDPARIALLGWSNGGGTVLNAVAARPIPPAGPFRAAVAFYPGCRVLHERGGWAPPMPLLLLIGERDDWTAAAPCRALVDAARAKGAPAELVTYPNAYHDFDNPSAPLRTRTGLAYTADGSGTATAGTDPEARADAIVRVLDFLGRTLGP